MQLLLALILIWPLALQAAEWTSRPLQELAVFAEFRAPAAVVAADEARLAAEVGARILAMPVRAGEAVAHGAELVRLDDASYRLELQRTQAQLRLIEGRIALARAQLEQSRALAQRGFISADGLRIRETELEVSIAERDAAQPTGPPFSRCIRGRPRRPNFHWTLTGSPGAGSPCSPCRSPRRRGSMRCT